MPTIVIDTRQAMADLQRGLNALQREQIPYATAVALTDIAGRIAWSEQLQLSRTFDHPTAFTKQAFGVKPARKNNLTATVFAKNRQSQYLEPYVVGGKQALFTKKGMLTPATGPGQQLLNAYGNLPRKKLQQLKSRPDVFVGPVKFKDGRVLNGVWQRGLRGKRREGDHGTKGSLNQRHNASMGVELKSTLKLLIVFTDPKSVTKSLPFGAVALKELSKAIPSAWGHALAKALATAR